MKQIFRLISVILLCCFFADTNAQNIQAFIQQRTDSTYEKEKLPGIFVGIINNNEKKFYTAGFANPENKIPFDATTFFEIGSITKTFTAYVLVAVLMKKNISETDAVYKYLPDSVQQNETLKNMTFLSLMNHTSGLPRLPGNMKQGNPRQPYENYSSTELFSYLKSCTLNPDGKSSYSNLGAGLAGVLAERISGKSYAALLDQYIFLPFKMLSPENAIASSANKSQGYFAKDDKAEYWNMNILAPAGGLKCNGNEMLAYLQNMCFPQTENSKAIVNKLTSQTIPINTRIGIGLGWHILNEKDKQPVYWHNGGTYGFSTFCAFSKDKSKAVFVIINQFSKNAACDGLGISIIKKMISEE